jgi:hypothetical protein
MRDDLADVLASPLRCSQVPERKTPMTVSVAEARVATEASAHQDRRFCAARKLFG